MNTLLQDFRYAFRSLRRTPAFTVAATLCIALGIGANTAIFSVINGVLLKPLPYKDPSRLVMVWETKEAHTRARNVVSPADYLDWRTRNTSFSEMAAAFDWRTGLASDGDPEVVPVTLASASYFPLLGAQPQIGRVFTAEDEVRNAPHVAVLSDAIWRRRFSASRDVLGKTVTLGGTATTVIGVLEPGFHFGTSEAAIWLPLGLDPAADHRKTSGRWLYAMARLKTGASVASAQADLAAVARRLEQEHPVFNTGWGVNVVALHEQVVGDVQRALLVLGGVVGFVLLIACANVANLQLARAAGRQRDLALRAALGADRARIVRELLTESVALSLLGGALGLLFASWGTTALAAAAPESLPRAREIQIDAVTLAFTLGLSVVAGLLFGLAPAIQTGRAELHTALKAGSRGVAGGHRARSALVASQVALSLMLLIGAGLMIRSFLRLTAETPGFDAENVLTMRVDLPGVKYTTSERRTAFFEQLLDRVRALPNVRGASAIDWLPFAGLGSATNYFVEGAPAPAPGQEIVADIRRVDRGYFRTMRIPVIAGEPFTTADNAAARKAVVINQTLARTVFRGVNPIGQHVLMPWGDTLRGEIVAVVGDTKHTGLDSLPRSMIYWAMPQFQQSFMTLVVRTAIDPMRMASAVAAEVRKLDPSQPVADVKSLDSYLGQSVARRRFNMTMVGAFAGLALVLAALGIYGVIAYSVSQRTREIGVRIALGARERSVRGLIVREGMQVVGVGIAIGVIAALLLTRVMAGLLYGVSATDPLTFIAVAVVLGGVAMLASYLPARRASRVDPVVALRSE
jgi:putative ABC transport system permease protein